MKTTAEDEGEEGREGGYMGEEEERDAASSGVENKPKTKRDRDRRTEHNRDTGRGLQMVMMRRR